MDAEAHDATAETRLNRLLAMILDAAVEGMGFDAATITARDGADVATVAATDQQMLGLDESQYESKEGPCVEVLDPHDPIYLDDAPAADERWQHFAQTAAHLGVGSSLSVHLPIDSETVAGSMNLYSKRQLHLDDERIAAALPYATQLAAAMESINAYRATATLAQNMAEAMRSRAVIEQAKGMLMSEKQISADDAFQALRSMSQKSNIKVRDVALRLVEGRSGIPQSLE